MRAYGIIKSTFWLRGSGKRLRGNPEAQVLALYLMTCSQGTMCGIFHVALPTVAHDTGISMVRIGELLVTLSEIVAYDPDEELCWVPNAAREQVGASLSAKDKKRPGVMRELKQFGHHPFVGEFFRLYMDPYLLDAEWSIWNSSQPPGCGNYAPSKPLRSPSRGSLSEADAPSKPLRSPSRGSLLEADAPSKPPVQEQVQEQVQVQVQDHVVILSEGARDEVSMVHGSPLDGAPPTRYDNHTPEPLAKPPGRPVVASEAVPARRTSTKTQKPKAERFVPEDWQPHEAHLAKAQALGVSINQEVQKFRCHEFRVPKSDWNKAFFGWLIRAGESGTSSGGRSFSSQRAPKMGEPGWRRQPDAGAVNDADYEYDYSKDEVSNG